jgi:outer membrane protein OmpA-like peptidoglycan-associated protein
VSTPLPPPSPSPSPPPPPPVPITLDDQKKIAEIAKLNSEKLKTLAGLSVGVASTVGLVTVFIYCFFVARFFPSGLKAGDTLFFVFAMLGLALTGLIIAGFGMLVFAPWITRRAGSHNGWIFGLALSALFCAMAVRGMFANIGELRSCAFIAAAVIGLVALVINIVIAWKLHNDRTDFFSFFLLGLVFATTIGYISLHLAADFEAFKLIAGVLLSGMFVTMGIDLLDVPVAKTVDQLEKNKRKLRGSAILILLGCLLPYIACGREGQMLRYLMTGMGVYTEQATIIVNKAVFGKLQAAADSKGILLYSCRMDEENVAVSKMRIWWHGIGDRSYVGLGLDDEATRIELDSAGVLKSASKEQNSCIELRRGIFFDSNAAEQTPGQWSIARPVISRFLKKKADNDSLLVIGYADPMPRDHDDNMLLARDRACAIYRKLNPEDLLSMPVQIDIRGDMHGMEACDVKSVPNRERACEARNRRVELRLIGGDGVKAGLSPTAAAEVVCKEDPSAAKQPAKAGSPARAN